MKEYGEFGETELRDLTSEPYTIRVKYHEGASKLGSDIHGVMCDLAASETVELKQGEVKVIPLGVSMKLPHGDFGIVVPRSSTCLKHGIMMANSIGIIEPDYCGDSDIWGFVAYAIRDTVIEQGTRIAQFMPAPLVPDWDKIMFEECESMGFADRGGYGSTGERSAEVRTYRGANGLGLHVGDYVIDEFGERYCVMGLHEGDGATAAYADLGNSRTPLEVAPCLSLRLDKSPHDRDGVLIEVGDTVYTDEDGSLEVAEIRSDGRIYVLDDERYKLVRYGNELTHRKPDSWDKLLGDLYRARNEGHGDGECLYADCASGNCGDCRFDSRQLEPQDCCIDHIFGDIADRIRTLREVR